MGLSAAESDSRAVEFAVNEEEGTVRQVWSYGQAPYERLFAGFQGGVIRLPKTGNTFVTYGGICSIGGRPATGPDRFEDGEAQAPEPMEVRALLREVMRQGEAFWTCASAGRPVIRKRY